LAIFQKIAASSFAAVRRTLKRRLLMLTLHEALLRDKELDIEGAERLLEGSARADPRGIRSAMRQHWAQRGGSCAR